MKGKLWLTVPLIAMACTHGEKQEITHDVHSNASANLETPMTLSQAEAEHLAEMPLACIDQEYPNKLNQVIGSEKDLESPEVLHPAFYGCFDWHSAVHGHWSLVNLLKKFPTLTEHDRIVKGLQRHLSKERIAGELKYFEGELSQGFERMYGWAWLLKLSEELHTWDLPEARELEENLRPLTALIVDKFKTFLPKLTYPIRVGTHTNSAFALSMAYDYAKAMNDTNLRTLIAQRSRDFYESDQHCPVTWEPSGYDFLSPCLEEADLMRKVLSKEEFKSWIREFLPELSNPEFQLDIGIVSDRTDGHLVHLDGLNFSRAWCLFGIANDFPETYGHLNAMANKHIQHSLPQVAGDSYEGGALAGKLRPTCAQRKLNTFKSAF